MKVGIIGGGASGFFSAITIKEIYPDCDVTIFEKKSSFLSKVKISGGGRCNVTNACDNVNDLCKAYPRGGKKLKKLFYQFSNKDLMNWFEQRGVPLVIEKDNCVFPQSQDSQSIIDCLINQAKLKNIILINNITVKQLEAIENHFYLEFDEEKENNDFDKIIICIGGIPKASGFKWLESLGHEIIPPVPSLFTFNIPNNDITQLMGITIDKAIVSIQGTKFKTCDTLLITHWGFSGPAILKLSSFAARYLHDLDYNLTIQINWVNESHYEVVQSYLNDIIKSYPNKTLKNYRPYKLPERLWYYILDKCLVNNNIKWNELGKKSINKLINVLTNDNYKVKGKSNYKEEFVTCGGISLNSIDLNSMQSKSCKNLYFAGEVLDIDAITGGYNLQAAWTTGFIAGKLL